MRWPGWPAGALAGIAIPTLVVCGSEDHDNGSAPAHVGTTVVMIHGLPPGQYAVQTFHDENGNKKVDRNFIGLPREGVGFSNDAPIRMGPPKWADAMFAFNGAEQTIQLKTRYFLGQSGPDKR